MKKFLPILLVFALLFSLSACGDEPEDDEEYLDTDACVFWDVDTPVVGDHMIIVEHADSFDCTPEALAKWYKQDVKANGYKYGLVLYDDAEGIGVYAANNVITTEAVIEDNSFVDMTDKSVVYAYKNGKLEKQ